MFIYIYSWVYRKMKLEVVRKWNFNVIKILKIIIDSWKKGNLKIKIKFKGMFVIMLIYFSGKKYGGRYCSCFSCLFCYLKL